MYGTLGKKVLTYRWAVFWIMALAYVFVYFHRLCPSVVATDLQKAFHASATLTGLLASAYFYPYALMQLPAGLLSDSLGARKSVTIFLTLAAIGSFILGMAPRLDMALGGRVLVGLGVSMVFVPTMKLLSQWFRIREFALMVGILTTMGGIGAYCAYTPLARMTAWQGWRASFLIIAVGTLVIAVLVWLFVRNRPSDMGWPSIAELDQTGLGSAAPPMVIPLWEGVCRVVTEKFFWPIAIWFFFLCGILFGFGGLWAGPYLQHVYGMSAVQAARILDMVAVGMIVGSPLLSLLSDRVFHSRKRVLTLASAILVAQLAVLNFFPMGLARPTLYVAMFILSVCSAAIVVIGFTTTKELFPVEIAGTSVGTVNLFPFLGGAVFQPVLGRILEAYPRTASGGYAVEGYQALLMTLLGASVVCLVCTFFMKETFPGSMKR